MRIGFFTITEWIAVISFLAGLVFGFAKLYSTLQSILTTLKTLVANFQESSSDRAVIHRELDQLKTDFVQHKVSTEEKIKTLFKYIPEKGERGKNK